MAKRSDVSRDSRVRVELPDKPDDVKPEELTVLEEPKRVWVRNRYPANISMIAPSGERYIFRGPGTEVKVREEDVETLLAKRRGGCCGAVPSFVFELVN